MSGRLGVHKDWFSAVEEAEIKRLAYQAFDLRGAGDAVAYTKALKAIEGWQVETHPERLRRKRSA